MSVGRGGAGGEGARPEPLPRSVTDALEVWAGRLGGDQPEDGVAELRWAPGGGVGPGTSVRPSVPRRAAGPGSPRSLPAGQRWAAGPSRWGCGTGRPRCGCGRGTRRCCFPGCPLPRRGRSSRRCCSPWPPASGTWRSAWKVRPRDGAEGEGRAARGRRRGPCGRGGGGLYSIRPLLLRLPSAHGRGRPRTPRAGDPPRGRRTAAFSRHLRAQKRPS